MQISYALYYCGVTCIDVTCNIAFASIEIVSEIRVFINMKEMICCLYRNQSTKFNIDQL